MMSFVMKPVADNLWANLARGMACRAAVTADGRATNEVDAEVL